MVRETWVQSQVASYQRLKKWYLIPPCLKLSNIRYLSRVKWSNPGKGVAPSPTPSSYWKGSLLIALDYSRQIYLLVSTQLYIKYLYLIQMNFPNLYGFKYSYQILIIYTQLYRFKNYPYLLTVIRVLMVLQSNTDNLQTVIVSSN